MKTHALLVKGVTPGDNDWFVLAHLDPSRRDFDLAAEMLRNPTRTFAIIPLSADPELSPGTSSRHLPGEIQECEHEVPHTGHFADGSIKWADIPCPDCDPDAYEAFMEAEQD